MNTSELNLLSNPDEVENVLGWLNDALAGSQIEEEQFIQFRYAVVEAVNNCIEHSYELQPDKPIKLVCETSNNWVAVTIQDQGIPFNIPDDIGHDSSLTDESGRGLTIIKAWVSSVHTSHAEGWNTTKPVRRTNQTDC